MNPAIPAATVVLLRDGTDGVETLMLHRTSKVHFGEMWVFPGGRIDDDDHAGVDDIEGAARRAAAREAQEETGLVVRPDEFAWFAHWTPPPSTPRRYATWFFATALDADDDVLVDGSEIQDHRWIHPEAMLDSHRRGEVDLVPPTWITLYHLSRYFPVSELMTRLQALPPRVYETHIGQRSDGVRVAMWEGDAGYAETDPHAPGERHRLVLAESGFVFGEHGRRLLVWFNMLTSRITACAARSAHSRTLSLASVIMYLVDRTVGDEMEIKLDPELQAVVDATVEANPDAPHAADVPLEALRAGYVMIGQAQSIPDVPCGQIEDFAIPGPAGDIGARAYVPADVPASPMPCLIYIHGGGFMIGDLDSHDSVCRQLANGAGCKVIAIDYRLAPEHKFPAAVEDAMAAATWIVEHAGELELDPARIAIGGDSAGGNLSAIVSNALGRDKLKFQLLIYPATDRTQETESLRELQEGVTLDAKILAYFNDGYFGGIDVDTSDPRISPARADDHTNAPPARVVTAEYDPLRDEGEAYAKILDAAGVPVTCQRYQGLMHNFVQQTAVVSAAKRAVIDLAEALAKGLR
ncbi:MAG: alpha/beta hydrolase [Gammaproteobacteria bacterium]|nr:alpha/beta hydrolase [Gammaproteobacteria bacterium]